MVDITPLIRADRKVIQGYQGGWFVVSGEVFTTPILIFESEVRLWAVTSPEELTFEGFAPVLNRGVEILLLGGGSRAVFLPPSLRNQLKNSGISVDVMDTGAACRTYNVLMAEGRAVAGALFPSS